MNTKKPLLIFTTGVAGSGKTYFSTHLAKKLPAIWIDSDVVRAVQYDNPHDDAQNTALHHRTVFRSMDYFAKQALEYGANVIYDACTNQENVRQVMRDLATSSGALAVLLVIKTPVALAKTRAYNREETVSSWRMPPEHHDKHVTYYEEVKDTTNMIMIDGTLPFEEQYNSFVNQLERILK